MRKIEIDDNFFNKKLVIPKSLNNLNKIFIDNNFELFIVGGYIRDCILNIKNEDIDICSSATPDKLEEMLKGTEFLFTIVNKRLGTYKIYTRSGECSFEYTCFRSEKYDYGHSPSSVQFVEEIAVDAQRRDFTVDCIYYSLKTRQCFDPCGGIQDCQHRTLRIINDKVFDSDGLRILRMLRLAYTKDLKIDEDTYKRAEKQKFLLSEISHERVAKEIRGILSFNETNNRIPKSKYISSLQLIQDIINLQLLQYIFLDLPKYIDLEQYYELVEINPNLYDLAENKLGYALIYFLVTSIEDLTKAEIPAEFYFDILGVRGLMFPKNTVIKYRIVVDALVTLDKMIDKSLFINYVQLFYGFLDEIIQCRALLTNGEKDETLARLVTTERMMLANGIPRYYGDLNLNAEDIMNKWQDLPRNQIGQLLDCALIIATKTRRNEKEFLLSELGKLIKKGGKSRDDN